MSENQICNINIGGQGWVSGGQKSLIFFFLIKLRVSYCQYLLTSMENIMVCCTSSLHSCLSSFFFFLFPLSFSFPVVFGQSTSKWAEEKKLKQQWGLLCVDSAQYCLSRRWFGKVVSAASHTFHFSSSPDCSNLSFLSVLTLLPCFFSTWALSAHGGCFMAVFSQEQNSEPNC